MAEAETIADADVLLMTQAEYARHRGVTKQAIGNAVRDGKITLDDNGMVDVVVADRAMGNRARINEPQDDGPGDSNATAQLTKARTAAAIYQARNAQLDYEQKLGNAVPAAGVADAAAECGEVVVRGVRSLSSRADAFVANAKDVPTMRAFIKTIERDLLNQFSEAFAKMAADAMRVPKADEPDHETADAPEQSAMMFEPAE